MGAHAEGWHRPPDNGPLPRVRVSGPERVHHSGKESRMNPNSLLVWFPKVEALRLPRPRTKIVKVGWRFLTNLYDGKRLSANTVSEIKEAAEEIGYPLFMRTDLVSAKHSWRDSCYVPSQDDLLPHIGALVDFEGCCFMMGEPSSAIVLREYVPLSAAFTAFQGMPVARERRYFAEGGKVLCHHPYWPQGAIEEAHHSDALPDDWKQRLAAINEEDEAEIAELSGYAEGITSVLAGAWSVDFAYASAGKWLLIDMALAAQSWHPEECPVRVEGA